MSECHGLLSLKKTPLYGWTTFPLSIDPSVDTWVTSVFWLLQIMLLWTLMYKHLFKTLLPVPLEIHPGVNCWIIWELFVNPEDQHPVLCSNCTISLSFQPCTRFQLLHIISSPFGKSFAFWMFDNYQRNNMGSVGYDGSNLTFIIGSHLSLNSWLLALYLPAV